MKFLEKFFSKYYIENLTLYLMLFTAIVSGYCIIDTTDLGKLNEDLLVNQNWINLFLYPFVVRTSFFGSPWVGLFFYMYFFFFLGSILEGDLGSPRYNIFILLGVIINTIGAYISLFIPLNISSLYIYSSLFLAVAYRVPEMEIYLFFLLPIKLKWIGWFTLIIELYTNITDSLQFSTPLPMIGMLLGYANLLIFYGKDIWFGLKGNYSWQMRHTHLSSRKESFHRCCVCNLTENDDPKMEFRYCIDCSDHEYCMNHLHQHTHVKN